MMILVRLLTPWKHIDKPLRVYVYSYDFEYVLWFVTCPRLTISAQFGK
jgi:hypothetical protein